MLRIFDYTIAPSDAGKTIENFLLEHGYTRAILTHLKKTPESILLNGVWEYLHTHLSTEDILCIHLTETDSSAAILPTPLPLSICYEDEDILVINKPAGMPVHPSKRHPTHTLANAVCAYFHAQGTCAAFRCVNRIDRDTTGLVLLAKHALSSAILNQAVRKKEIHREYLALASGRTPQEGTISAPIGRKDSTSIERIIDFSSGASAITHYKRLLYTNELSLLLLCLETGRTHQIRVHLKYLGYPLLGDALYNPAYFEAFSGTDASRTKIKRQALHSYRLQFSHPITGVPMDLTAPLPADMEALISQVPPAHMQSAPSRDVHE